MNHKIKIPFFVLLAVSCSCQKATNTINIDPAPNNVVSIQGLKAIFESEANTRGKKIDFGSTEIQIKENLGGAGFSDVEKKIVFLDKVTWDSFNNLEKESLLFHELGHLLLGRPHQNLRFGNGEYVSMMRAGDAGKVQGIDYQGDKRKYYLDELFNEKTSKPIWIDEVKYKDDIGNDKKKLVFKEDFSNNTNLWPVSKTTDSLTIQNGKYVIKGTQNSIVVNAPIKIDTTTDYDLEFEMKIIGFSATLSFGQVGLKNSLPFSVFDNDLSVSFKLQNLSNFGLNLFSKQFIKNEFNNFRIRKLQGKVHFFINNEYIYSYSLPSSQSEKPLWIVCFRDSNTEYQFDNFKYSVIIK